METSSSTLRAIWIGLCLVAAALLTPRGNAAATITNEYWLAPYSAGTGSGTIDAPIDASTRHNFDTFMFGLSSNCIVHLLPGTFYTGGNNSFLLKTGVRILGSGIDKTTVVITNGNSVSDTFLFAFMTVDARNTYNEVADLTIDANGNFNGQNIVGGVGLYGSFQAIRRVRCINATDKASNSSLSEGFPIAIVCPSSTGYNEGNIIEECEVSKWIGSNFCSAITFTGGYIGSSGIIQNNRVILDPVFSGGFNYGINITGTRNVLVRGNYVSGANQGVYCDTPPLTNVTIAHNVFKNVSAGVHIPMLNGDISGLVIENNHVELSTNLLFGTVAGFSIWIQSAGYTGKGISIVGNTIRMLNDGTHTNTHGISLVSTTGTTVRNNILRNEFYNQQQGTNDNWFDNRDWDGNFITSVNQTLPISSLKRKAVASGPYNISLQDRYIGVTGTSITLNLPSATGHDGKEYVIVDEAGTAGSWPVTVAPNGSQKINGVNASKTITNNYGSMKLLSNGTDWFTQ